MYNKIFFVITGAQGSGKTGVIEKLKRLMPLYLIKYVCTRSKEDDNHNEVTWEEFQKLAENDNFIISFNRQNALFGVTYEELKKAVESNLPIIWEADLDWLEIIKNEYPETVFIMINGLSVEDFYERFENKGNALPQASALMARRSKDLNIELNNYVDYVVDNKKDEAENAAQEIKKIIEGKANSH